MKKATLVLLALLTAAAFAPAGAQRNEPHSAVQVSFFPPLGTNGFRSADYTNDFSLNILAGLSKNERAFTFGGLANIIRNDATGFQLAGLTNYIGGEGSGFQIAGLSNIGLGEHKGMQLGGLFNTAGELDGFQLAGLFNIAKDVDGVQFAGLANIARDVDGFQLSGLFNIAKDVDGVQFAGLVNVAEHSDYPIGIVNIIRDGEMGIGIGYNEIGTVSLNFRSGGRVLYGILGAGYNHKVADSEDAVTFTAGYGAHINIARWFRINNELTTESIDIINSEGGTFKSGYALLPAFRLGRFELFGGPSINYMQTSEAKMYDLFPKNSIWDKQHASGKLQKVFIGWQAGVQVLF